MRPTTFLCALLAAGAATGFSAVPLRAMDPTTQVNQPEDVAEQDAKRWADMEQKAAEFQRRRATAPAELRDDAKAKAYLDRARELLTTGHEIRARWWAEDAFEEFPYSRYAGDALRMGLEGAAVQNNMGQVCEKLQMLWLFVPDYPGLGEAMERAMSVAEDAQDFTKAVHLESDDPADVIRIEGRSTVNDVSTARLLNFLALHGDRETIAPRAALGQARGQLLDGGKDNIFAARRSYEKFLEDYPATYLTFNAICEYALSHLVSYRGSDYDMGVLEHADLIIDQAEIETRGDKARAELVLAYRQRIRSWRQDRDLSIARWYRARGTPAVLRWASMPPGLLSWDDGARYYFRQVIRRDATSPQGRAAERELALLPDTRSDLLGAAAQ